MTEQCEILLFLTRNYHQIKQVLIKNRRQCAFLSIIPISMIYGHLKKLKNTYKVIKYRNWYLIPSPFRIYILLLWQQKTKLFQVFKFRI